MEQLWKDMEALGLNLYDMALITEECEGHHCFQPASNCHNGYSVTKAFIVTAIGLLFDDGLLRPENRLCDFLPVPEGRWREVTLHHLLTHTTGVEKGFLDIDVEDVRAWQTEEYLDLAFAQPLPYAPGTHGQYSDGAFYLLSRVVSAVAGETADALLARRVLRPMNFGETAWSRCPKGHPIGATGLYSQAQDVVKLGWLYLNGGVYEGQRLLSEEWTKLVVDNHYEFNPMVGGWIGKGGMYGQRVAFHPVWRAAVAWHGFSKEDVMPAIVNVLNRHLEKRNEHA
ncbi:MAG: serine hydrolase [Clostridia bacterium]|nr:serine hydrolase [Clostridia bacterium]